ncbi:MAG: hypothetical protein Q9M27_06665 [Mariprofundaceae bacterium]|jgi:hypothetical protein|nr:hypothetical protein [Mariprofundaceae bacterium]
MKIENRKPMATRLDDEDDGGGTGLFIGAAQAFFIYSGVALIFSSIITEVVIWRMGDGLADQWWALLHAMALLGVLAGAICLIWAGEYDKGDHDERS